MLTLSTPREDQVQTFSSCGKLGVPRSAQCLLGAWIIQGLGRKPYLLEVIPKGQVALNLRKTKGRVVLSTRMLTIRASWGVSLEGSIGSAISVPQK